MKLVISSGGDIKIDDNKIDVFYDDLATLQLITYEVRQQRSSARINKEYSGVKTAIVMNPKDNVATALSDLRCGGTLKIGRAHV